MDVETIHKFSFIFMAVIIPFGVVGNILSFVTWSVGKRCRHLPVSCYFKPLAIVDTFVLLVPALEYTFMISPLGRFNFRIINFSCKFLSFTAASSFRLSIWITVALAIDKTCRLYMPFKFTNQKNSKRIYITVAILALVSLGMGMPFLLDRISKAGNCIVPQDSFSANYLTYYIWLQFLFLYTFPFIIVTVCNIMILVKMLKRSNNAVGNQNTEQQSRRQAQLKYTTYQVIVVCIVYCVTTVPYGALWISLPYIHVDYSYAILVVYQLQLAFAGLRYLNNAINFILYCAIGSDFRQDFKELLACCFCCCCRN